jgi:hypothetical protein
MQTRRHRSRHRIEAVSLRRSPIRRQRASSLDHGVYGDPPGPRLAFTSRRTSAALSPDARSARKRSLGARCVAPDPHPGSDGLEIRALQVAHSVGKASRQAGKGGVPDGGSDAALLNPPGDAGVGRAPASARAACPSWGLGLRQRWLLLADAMRARCGRLRSFPALLGTFARWRGAWLRRSLGTCVGACSLSRPPLRMRCPGVSGWWWPMIARRRVVR